MRTKTTLFTLAILLVTGLSAQKLPSYDELMAPYLSKDFIKKFKFSKGQQNAKALSFHRAHYELEYDTANQVWDSITRNTQYIDVPTGFPGFYFAETNQRYNGQFWINADSTQAKYDTTRNLFKVPAGVAIFDSLFSFSYDSANANWVGFLKTLVSTNSNNDITKSETYLNLAAFGIPGGFILFSQTDFYYNGNNDITYWLTKELDFSVGMVNADSVIATVNANGYRTSDTYYKWKGSSWSLDERTLYTYDNSNNVIVEIEQYYDSLGSTFVNSNKSAMSYNANGDVLVDSAYTFNTSWEINRIQVYTYTSFNEDLTHKDYAVQNGTPYLYDDKTYYYNSNNQRDSSYTASLYSHNPSLSLLPYEKEIYRYTPFPVSGGTGTTSPAAPSNLLVVAGQKMVIPTMDLVWTDNSNNELGFGIQRSADSTNWTAIDSAAANAVSYRDTNVVGGQKYYYRVFSYNGNGSSSYSNVSSGTTLLVGIEEAKEANQVSIYPNPFSKQIIVKGLNQTSRVRIMNLTGKLVLDKTIHQNENINTSELPSGMYFMELNGRTYKIIKE